MCPIRSGKIATDQKEVALLFSGGIDSTLAAVILSLKDYKIHLLTMDNGVSDKSKYTEDRYNDLKELFPNNIVTWKRLICKKLFIDIAIEDIDKNMKKYRSNLLCLGCKLSMHTVGLTYCLDNNIKNIADGYTQYQNYLAEQVPESIELVKNFDGELGINYINPVIDYKSKVDVKKELLDFGLYTKSLESECTLARAFGKLNRDFTVDEVVRFTADKLKICEQYILDFLVKRSKIDYKQKIEEIDNVIKQKEIT